MARDFTNVVKSGGVLKDRGYAITLPKALMERSRITHGSRVLIENDGPDRIIITLEPEEKEEAPI